MHKLGCVIIIASELAALRGIYNRSIHDHTNQFRATWNCLVWSMYGAVINATNGRSLLSTTRPRAALRRRVLLVHIDLIARRGQRQVPLFKFGHAIDLAAAWRSATLVCPIKSSSSTWSPSRTRPAFSSSRIHSRNTSWYERLSRHGGYIESIPKQPRSPVIRSHVIWCQKSISASK